MEGCDGAVSTGLIVAAKMNVIVPKVSPVAALQRILIARKRLLGSASLRSFLFTLNLYFRSINYCLRFITYDLFTHIPLMDFKYYNYIYNYNII